MALRLIVLDVAGTTVHDGGGAVQRALADALERRGLSVRPDALAGVTGLAKPHAIRLLVEGHGRDEMLADVDAIHADFASRMQRYYRQDPSVRAIEGVEPALRALRRAGLLVALDTGFSRAVLEVILARLGWDGADAPIDAAIASDEVARGRPYPDMIDALRERLGGIPPEAVAKVGDTPVDLLEGTMARCGLVVGVLSGSHGEASLREHPHDHLIGGVAELPALLARLGLLAS